MGNGYWLPDKHQEASIAPVSRKIITVDADGTILMERGDDLAKLLEWTGTPFNQEIFAQTHDWCMATGLSNEEVAQACANVTSSEFFPITHPVPGAREALETLARWADIHLVTARSVGRYPQTCKEVVGYFGKMVVVNEAGHGCNGCKYKYVHKLGSRVHIDDSSLEALSIAKETTTHVVILPAPIGRAPLPSPLPERVHVTQTAHQHQQAGLRVLTKRERDRVYTETWKEIIDIVREILAPTKATC